MSQSKLKREYIKSFCYVLITQRKGKKIYYVWFWNEKGLHIQGNQWKSLRQEVIRENEWLFGMITVKQNTENAQRHSPISY